MKKFSAFLLLAALVSVLAACNSNSAPKIAVVDGAKVFRESKPGQDAMAYLRAKSTELQSAAKAAQAKVQAKQTRENAEAFQEAVTKYQTTMGAEQQRVVALLQDQFTKILDKYRKDNKVDVILAKDVVLSSDDSADITNKVIEEMNKVKIDLNPPAAAEGGQDNATSAAGGNAGTKAAPVKAASKRAAASKVAKAAPAKAAPEADKAAAPAGQPAAEAK